MAASPAPRTTCPACGGLLAISGRNHCPKHVCGWLVCECRAVIDTRSPRFYRITKETPKP